MGGAMGRPKIAAAEADAESRLSDLRRAADGFSSHLKGGGVPSILGPELRLGVAVFARDALLLLLPPTEGRGELTTTTTPSTPSFLVPPSSSTAAVAPDDDRLDGVRRCLASIILDVINRQDDLDAVWYQDSVATLRDAFEGYDDIGTGEEADLACRAAFCEVLLIAAASHGIRVAFLALGVDVPPLPTWGELATGGEGGRVHPPPADAIRFSSLLRRVRRDEGAAIAPYFLRRDVDAASPEYAKVDGGVWDGMMFWPTPCMCTVFAPHDNAMFCGLLKTFYLSGGQMVRVWNTLDPSTRCPSVSRSDLETVAAAVASAHGCGF